MTLWRWKHHPDHKHLGFPPAAKKINDIEFNDLEKVDAVDAGARRRVMSRDEMRRQEIIAAAAVIVGSNRGRSNGDVVKERAMSTKSESTSRERR